MSRPVTRLLLILATTLLAACAAAPPLLSSSATAELPVQSELTTVPFFPQEDHYCGPAALASALAWSGLPVTQAQIADQVYTPGRQGTLRSDILTAARRNGRLAVPVSEFEHILTEIAAGHPVIVFQNLALDWLPQWHFAVAIGYDLAQGNIILHSGDQIRRVTPLATFARTWQRGERWALVVLPPDKLPATAKQGQVLQAAAGLERAGRHADAARAYATALNRWPQSIGAQIGLGNAQYALGDLTAAATTFQNAVANHPQIPMLWNNLAYVLAGQGRLNDAIAAAEQAVLHSNNAHAYRATLNELLDRGI